MELRSGYKQTEAGVFPEDWAVKPILECCDYVDYRGKTPPKTQVGTFLVTARNVRKGFIDYLDSQEFVPTELYDQIMLRGKPALGDVLITTEAPLGNVAQIDRIDVALAQRIIKYRPKSAELTSTYLKYYLLSEQFQKVLDDHSSGSTAKGIKGRVLHQLPVIIPPTSEQRAISEALGDVDELIGSLERLIAKKRDIKQAVMQQLLTGKTRLQGFSGEWQTVSLGSVAEMNSGGTPATSNEAYYGGDIPFVSISDMTGTKKILTKTERTLTAAGFASSAARMFQPGTVLYAMYASLGECAIAGISLCTSQAILGIRPHSSLRSEFLYYYLTSLKIRVKSLGQQGTQSNLNKRMVQDFEFALPPLEEQQAISEVLGSMDEELGALEQRLSKTRDIKQGMMQQLLTGKVRLV